jgi:hypothetical protein
MQPRTNDGIREVDRRDRAVPGIVEVGRHASGFGDYERSRGVRPVSIFDGGLDLSEVE